jgi:hypothetical protein
VISRSAFNGMNSLSAPSAHAALHALAAIRTVAEVSLFAAYDWRRIHSATP